MARFDALRKTITTKKDDVQARALDAAQRAQEETARITGASSTKVARLVQSSLAEIRELEELLPHCGFLIGDIAMTVGISPKLTISVEQVENAEIDLSEVHASDDLSKTTTAVLRLLKTVYAMTSTFEGAGYTIGQVDIEVGITPKVTAHLYSRRSRAFNSDGATVTFEDDAPKPAVPSETESDLA